MALPAQGFAGRPRRWPTSRDLAPDRDGILDPRASEPVAKPPEIEAVDRWAAEPDNLAAWEAARRWLAHAAGDVGEALDVARTALLLASDGPERERVRRELLDLLADRRPLAASAHFRPAANITDPLPRPVLRAAGMSPQVLAMAVRTGISPYSVFIAFGAYPSPRRLPRQRPSSPGAAPAGCSPPGRGRGVPGNPAGACARGGRIGLAGADLATDQEGPDSAVGQKRPSARS